MARGSAFTTKCWRGDGAVRLKKSCRRCEKMVQPAAPSRPIPGSMAGPGLLAHVLVSKFDDHVSL